MSYISRIFTILGFFVLCHAAYSANHYKNLSMLAGIGAKSLPIDVIIESLSALGLIMIGQVMPLKFEKVVLTADSASKTTAEQLGRPDMMVFNHRGKELFKRMKKSATTK